GHGAFDALLALGIVLTYRTSGVLNFAQASTGTFAAFVMVSVAQGRPLLLALGAGMLAGAAAGAGTYGVVREIRATSNPLTAAVATLAVALVLQQFVRVGWGSDPTNLVFPQPFGFDTFSVGSVVIAHIYVAALATA